MSQKPRRRWDLTPWERIQKARHTKNVKKYRTFKERKNLVNALEEDAQPEVIVSSQLGLPGALAERQDETDSRAGPSHKPSHSLDVERNVDAPQQEESDGEAEKKEVKTATESIGGAPGTEIDSPENAASKQENEGRASGKKKGGKARNPFQKELRRREQKRKEQERVEAEWAREEAEYKARKEETRQRRKRGAKQYRSVTRRGQPRMKHRTDALLAEVERRLGAGGSASGLGGKDKK